VERGASQDPERQWLIVGAVAKPHGVHGDLLVEIITDLPDRLGPGVEFGLGPAEGPTEWYRVFRVRLHKGQWLLSVEGLREREFVESWRGQYLFLPELYRDERPEGYYYEHELVGLECRDTKGAPLGSVVGLESTGGQSRLVVQYCGQEHLVPWVPAIVTLVDLEAGVIVLDPPLGLLDDNDAVVVEPRR
jgi:16S rRNA processing protein RimM